MKHHIYSFEAFQYTFLFSEQLIWSPITSNNSSSSCFFSFFGAAITLYVYFCLNDRLEYFNQWRLLSGLTQCLLFSSTEIDSQKALTETVGVKKKHVREAVTAHFSWTRPLGSGPWAAISSHSCVFRPPSIPNNRPGSWPYSRKGAFGSLFLPTAAVFLRVLDNDNSVCKEGFRISSLFFAGSAAWWIDVSGFSLPRRADRGSAHTQEGNIIAGWCKGAPARHVS